MNKSFEEQIRARVVDILIEMYQLSLDFGLNKDENPETFSYSDFEAILQNVKESAEYLEAVIRHEPYYVNGEFRDAEEEP